MLVGTKRLPYFLFSLFILVILFPLQTKAQSVSLYTPFTKIVVPPGQAINYSVDVINNSNSIKTSNVKVVGLPKGWDYELKSGGWNVQQVSELPKRKETLSLKVDVPLKVDKGTYYFKVVAEGYSMLPLTVVVSKEGTYQAEFTSSQTNIEGASNATFTYNATLRNGTAQSEVYALQALQPTGWNVEFKAGGKQVSSVNIDANQTKRITIEVKPSEFMKAGTYNIPIVASAENISARLELQTVIIGTYDIALTTPTGLLSTDATAGDHKKVTLWVKDVGSTALNNIKLKAKMPIKWEVTFKPKEIAHLDAGKTQEVEATINVTNKALSGDYETDFEATSKEAFTNEKIRVTVHASMLSGWLGMLIILLAIGSVFYLMRKYGRR